MSASLYPTTTGTLLSLKSDDYSRDVYLALECDGCKSETNKHSTLCDLFCAFQPEGKSEYSELLNGEIVFIFLDVLTGTFHSFKENSKGGYDRYVPISQSMKIRRIGCEQYGHDWVFLEDIEPFTYNKYSRGAFDERMWFFVAYE